MTAGPDTRTKQQRVDDLERELSDIRTRRRSAEGEVEELEMAESDAKAELLAAEKGPSDTPQWPENEPDGMRVELVRRGIMSHNEAFASLEEPSWTAIANVAIARLLEPTP